MSEMVERVRAAIQAEIWPSDHEGAFWTQELEGAARAAIGAMREPTQAMLDCQMTYLSSDLGYDEMYRRMIDAALETA